MQSLERIRMFGVSFPSTARIGTQEEPSVEESCIVMTSENRYNI